VRVAESLEGLAEAELALTGTEGDGSTEGLRRVAKLLGAGESVRRTLNATIILVRAPVREKLICEVRTRLSNAEYERSCTLGQRLDLEDAIAYALDPL
jgi:hypothetical protein